MGQDGTEWDKLFSLECATALSALKCAKGWDMGTEPALSG